MLDKIPLPISFISLKMEKISGTTSSFSESARRSKVPFAEYFLLKKA